MLSYSVFANQASLPPLQAPLGVTHEWTAFVLPSGLPVVMFSDAISLGGSCSQIINFLKLKFKQEMISLIMFLTKM